jgi:SOS-response transcriptional repressor LexA
MDAISTQLDGLLNFDDLTPRQQEIFEWLAHYIFENGYPPTFRDIGKQFDISSPNAVQCHLKALEKKGKIKMVKHHSRGIRLVGIRFQPVRSHTPDADRTHEPNEPPPRGRPDPWRNAPGGM